jgi:prepilin-type N-terminal cleavage/methylation domain-containing protein
MSRHPRHAGWTLLEIMIGIAIMGLLLGIAVPTY